MQSSRKTTGADRNVREDPAIERQLMQAWASQSCYSVALFDEDLRSIFVNSVLRSLLKLNLRVVSVPQISAFPIVENLKCLIDDPLRHNAEWTGEIVVALADEPDRALTLYGSVLRIANAARTSSFALIGAPRPSNSTAGILAKLSKRERQVVDALIAGATSKVIAMDLGISHRTVAAHRSRIMRKVNAKSLPDLFKKIISA